MSKSGPVVGTSLTRKDFDMNFQFILLICGSDTQIQFTHFFLHVKLEIPSYCKTISYIEPLGRSFYCESRILSIYLFLQLLDFFSMDLGCFKIYNNKRQFMLTQETTT